MFFNKTLYAKGYYIVSELTDVLPSASHSSPLGYDNVDRFVDEVK